MGRKKFFLTAPHPSFTINHIFGKQFCTLEVHLGNFATFGYGSLSLRSWSLTVEPLLQYFQFPIWIANSHGNGVSMERRSVQDTMAFFLSSIRFILFLLFFVPSPHWFHKQTPYHYLSDIASPNTFVIVLFSEMRDESFGVAISATLFYTIWCRQRAKVFSFSQSTLSAYNL